MDKKNNNQCDISIAVKTLIKMTYKNDFQKLISFESMFTLQANKTIPNEFQLQTDPNTHLTLLFIPISKEKTQKWSGELIDINFVNNINAV